MRTIKHGIKILRWPRKGLTHYWILAKSSTLRGTVILWCRGYRKHETMIGTVMRRAVVRH